MSRAWMPIYWGDYLADTRHLTAEEHGAYLLLIGHYWNRGPLPDDDEMLCRVARVAPKRWSRVWKTISPFFDLKPNLADQIRGVSEANAKQMPSKCWHHKRIDKELEKAEIISTKRQLAGQIGGRASRGQSNGFRLGAEANAKQTGTQSQSHIKPSYSETGAGKGTSKGSKLPGEWKSPTNDELREIYKPQAEAAE